MKSISVEKFVRFVVALSGIYDVDDDGYIVQKGGDDKPAFIKLDGRLRQLMVLKDVIKDPDVIVINPMNENITDSNDIKWVYNALSAGLSLRVRSIAKHLHFIISSSKKSDDIQFTTEELNFASRHKNFNDKSLELVELLSKKVIGFMHVGYDRRQKKATLRCSIYDPDTPAEFPQFSNTVWKSVSSLFGDILGVNLDIQAGGKDVLSKYSFVSELINVPRLESVLNVYYLIYKHINQHLAMCDMEDPDFIVDLTEFGYHIENLQEYYNKSKWFTGAISQPDRNQFAGVQNYGPQRVGANTQVEISGIPPNPYKRMGQQQMAMYQQPQIYQPVIDYSRQPTMQQTVPMPFAQPMMQQPTVFV